MRAALLMHGNEADPVFCYANRTRAASVGSDLGRIHPPAVALSAEPLVQAERKRLLGRVSPHDFMDNYQGARIAKDCTRFRISGAVVWMVVVDGATHWASILGCATGSNDKELQSFPLSGHGGRAQSAQLHPACGDPTLFYGIATTTDEKP